MGECFVFFMVATADVFYLFIVFKYILHMWILCGLLLAYPGMRGTMVRESKEQPCVDGQHRE